MFNRRRGDVVVTELSASACKKAISVFFFQQVLVTAAHNNYLNHTCVRTAHATRDKYEAMFAENTRTTRSSKVLNELRAAKVAVCHRYTCHGQSYVCFVTSRNRAILAMVLSTFMRRCCAWWVVSGFEPSKVHSVLQLHLIHIILLIASCTSLCHAVTPGYRLLSSLRAAPPLACPPTVTVYLYTFRTASENERLVLR